MAKKYNCVKNGIQYFRKTKTIGHDINGNPIKKEFYGDGEKDADRQIEEYMDKLKSGINVDASKLTIQECMHQWLFDVLLYSKNKKSASFEKHEINYRIYIKNSDIGILPIQNIVSLPISKYYNKLYNYGIDIINLKTNTIKHKTVSENKIFDLNKTLRCFFNYCIKQKYILDNPCLLENIELPGNADGEEDETEEFDNDNIQAFSDNEMEIIRNNLKYQPKKDNTFIVAVQLDFITGLRLGELLGMKKKFITKYIVKVRNTLKRIKVFDTAETWHYETKLIKPKSRTSVRNVYFPKPFWETLELYFQEQESKWKNNGLEFNDDSLIFTTETCKHIDATNFRRSWRRFLKRLKVNYKKPHSIRDTYATTLIRKGASIHDVKSQLGHNSIVITEKYYISVFPEDKSEAVSLLDDIVV